MKKYKYQTAIKARSTTLSLTKMEKLFIELGNREYNFPYQRGFRAAGKIKGIKAV